VAAYVPFAWAQGGLMPVMKLEFIGGILWLAFVATFGAWGLYYLAMRRFTPGPGDRCAVCQPAIDHGVGMADVWRTHDHQHRLGFADFGGRLPGFCFFKK
jgi:hypothetical protein